MSYIEMFVAAVPKANRDAYIAHATRAAAVFKRYGAVEVVECWGVDVPDGEITSFPMAVKKTADEDVVTGWIVWPSRAARDSGMAQAMEDPDLRDDAMPFDGKRLIFGGFEQVLSA